MGFIAAKCPECGANISVDDTREAGICEYCGTAFVTEKVINNYVVNVYGNNQSNIESLLHRAEIYDNIGDSEKACKMYKEIIDLYPDDYRGWLGRLKHCYDDYWRYHDKPYTFIETYNIIKRYTKINNDISEQIKNALLVCFRDLRKWCSQEEWNLLLSLCPSTAKAGYKKASEYINQYNTNDKRILTYWIDYILSGRWEEYPEDKYRSIYDIIAKYHSVNNIDDVHSSLYLPCIIDNNLYVHWSVPCFPNNTIGIYSVEICKLEEHLGKTLKEFIKKEYQDNHNICYKCGRKKNIFGICKWCKSHNPY